jgi:GntR family transcriptional regulator / MocR family aminotransferase
MHLELDGTGPLYLQLTRALKAAIHDSRAKAGSRMPSTRDIAESLALSRNTVRTAFEQLIADGYLRGVAGSGSYVMPMTARTRPAGRARTRVEPQSAYARRLRAEVRAIKIHDGMRFNLQYGDPIHDTKAIDAWRVELAYAASRVPTSYPPLQGVAALREAIADYLGRRRGVDCKADDVIIVSGTQQAFALAARVLVDVGDMVIMEEPPYFGARHVFVTHGCELETRRTDSDGLVTDELPAQRPKLVVVTPSHQFPSGSLMSAARRSALLDYAQHQDCWVMEDDYDSEFRYDTRPVPALKSKDDNDRVIYVGSFSKVLSPALRMGYMVVPRALRLDFIAARYLMDLGGPTIEQAAMARFIASGAFERHLRRTVRATKRRRAALLEGLAAHGQGVFEVANSSAGMHVVAWMRGCSHRQCDDFIEFASQQGLGLHPIATHYTRRPPSPGLLLGFASLSPAEIAAAMKLLGRCVTAALRRGILKLPARRA